MSHYKAVWDSRTRVMTIACAALLIFVASLVVRSTLLATPKQFGALVGFGFLVGLLVIMAVLFGPRGYEIDHLKLYVLTWTTRFAFDLTRLIDASDRSGNEVFSVRTLRTFGCGGFFGYFGYFRSPDWGTFLAFVTHRDELVVLRFRDRTVVISPHGRESFLQQIRKLIQPNEINSADVAA